MRFNCTCPSHYTGQRCEKIKHARSCKDLVTNGAKISEMYFLYDSHNRTFPAFCDLDSEAGYVWALIQSFSLANKSHFTADGFEIDLPLNEDDGTIKWNAFRLSLSRMQSIANVSTHLRVTCNFPDDGLVYTDYARAKLEGHDLFGNWGARCRTYEFLNIRGIECQECTAGTWQKNQWHIKSADSSSFAGCQFDGTSGAVSKEQNFGRYFYANSAHRCSSAPNSTTQHWIGSKLSG